MSSVGRMVADVDSYHAKLAETRRSGGRVNRHDNLDAAVNSAAPTKIDRPEESVID